MAHYFLQSVVEVCLYCVDDHRQLTTATMAFGGFGAFRKTHGELWQVPLAWERDDMFLRADPCGYSDDVITHVQ